MGERQEGGKGRRGEFGARQEGAVAVRAVGEFVPWTDREAIVAAIAAIADAAPQVERNRPRLLDRQIGDTAPRIEAIGPRKGLRRAVVLEGAASTAAGVPRRAGRRVSRRLVGKGNEYGES